MEYFRDFLMELIPEDCKEVPDWVISHNSPEWGSATYMDAKKTAVNPLSLSYRYFLLSLAFS